MFIIIDTSFGAKEAMVVSNEDGENELFDTEEEANAFIENEIQSGIAVEIL